MDASVTDQSDTEGLASLNLFPLSLEPLDGLDVLQVMGVGLDRKCGEAEQVFQQELSECELELSGVQCCVPSITPPAQPCNPHQYPGSLHLCPPTPFPQNFCGHSLEQLRIFNEACKQHWLLNLETKVPRAVKKLQV